MFKKTLHILSLALCLACSVTVVAQMKTGRWTSYAVSGTMSKIAEASDKVYMHLGPSLFSLSDDNEFYSYSPSNKLSDTSAITGIWYCKEGRYLFVAYESGNIDIIYDDGRVCNMADIKDAVLTSGRNINDVAFAGGRIYVATDFGIVVFDAEKNQVIESGIYNSPIVHVLVMGDNLVLIHEHEVLSAPLDVRHNQLDRFVALSKNLWYNKVVKLDDNHFFYIHTSGRPYIGTLDFDAGTCRVAALEIGNNIADDISAADSGVAVYQGDDIYIYGVDNSIVKATLPEAFAGSKTYVSSGLESVWTNNRDGVACLDLSKSTPSVTMQPFQPEAFTMINPAAMVWSGDGSRLYVSNIGPSHHLAGIKGEGYDVVARVCSVEGGVIRNVMPSSVKLENSPELSDAQRRAGTEEIIGGPSRIAVDPDDQSLIYVPVRRAGVFAVRDGEFVALINSDNAPYDPDANRWSQNSFLAAIDQDDNLWIADSYKTPASIFVLSAAKRRSKIKNLTESDWTTVKLPESFQRPNRDYFVTFGKRSHYNIISSGLWGIGFLIMDNNGTPSNFRDDKFAYYSSVTDQNGNVLSLDYTTCAVEDAGGKFWVGTGQGLFVIDNPAGAMSGNTTVRRPIVPRNDGTQLGDYLLSTEKINAISVDPSNRKWIATESSGVYLVSADGTEIIANYNTSNSALPSNCVYTVSADPGSNKVYMGTQLGTVCFDSDSSPAAEDFSDVYAYPNPVRPEYSGWITIAGLMEGSLVKIADAAGNVFFQGRSEGGMIAWDGCDASGSRVRTGVYYVFASQGGEGTPTSGVVTKILVVN